MATPLTPDDLALFALPTEITLAHDGHRLAYTLVTQDLDANKRQSAIWLLDLHALDAAPHRFTAGTRRDRQPVWSPDDAQIAFISDRDNGSQVWMIPVNGGEPRKLTNMRYGASKPCWASSGKTLYFLAEVRDGEDPFLDSGEERRRREQEDADRLRHITRLQYRWDSEGIREGRTHIWAVDVTEDSPTPRQITGGDYDHADIACSPDDTQIAFVGDRRESRDASRTNEIWVLTLANGAFERLSSGASEVSRPSWSPDGASLAWYDMPSPPEHSVSNVHVCVATRGADGTWSAPRDILAGHDITTGQAINADLGAIRANPPEWAADGQSLYVTACERGTVTLWRVPLDGTPMRLTQGAHQIGNFAVLPDGRRCVAIAVTADHAPDIAQFSFDSLPATAPERWLTDANPWLRERSLAVPEHFAYTAPDGWQLEGWIIWPHEAQQPENTDRRWPVVLQVHGGPHGFYGPCLQTAMQLLAGTGYTVIYVNPRGSIGYGEVFARACDRDWGGGDYQDIMAGLDAALACERLDPERMAVTGTSYGGYMTNWIIGHTDRFKAAVTINSVTNLISIFGTGDIDTTFGLPEYGGTPWERWDYFVERSPITYAPKITTPTRVIGAEHDWRCPIEQSEQLYTALKLLGRAETDFLRVPGTSHSINTGSPKQRIAQRRAILEWIARFVPAGPRATYAATSAAPRR